MEKVFRIKDIKKDLRGHLIFEMLALTQGKS